MDLRILTRSVLPALLLAGPASAQHICDQIAVESIQYAPFGGGLEVMIHNGNDQFLSHPSVLLVNTTGDTLGTSSMSFFGIAEHSSQLHQVEIAGAPTPSPFSGAVHVNYIDMDGSGGCVIQFKGAILCPEQICTPLTIMAYQFGNLPAGELSWTLTNTSGEEMAQGTLVIDPNSPGADTDEVCLPAGGYILRMEQTSGELGEFPITITSAEPTSGGFVKGSLQPGEPLEMPFTLYGPCVGIAQGVRINEPVVPLVWTVGQQLHIATDGTPIGPIQVLDAMGRTVQQGRSSSDRAVIDLPTLSHGTYLLRSLDPANPWRTQRFVLR